MELLAATSPVLWGALGVALLAGTAIGHFAARRWLPDSTRDAPMRLDYPDAEIRIHATTEIERQHRVRSCAKEPWTVQWLDSQVQPGETVYDIGANVGTFTLIAAVARGAHVIAFEPGYANFARLCENIELNGCSDRVVPVPLSLAESNGLVRFAYRAVGPGYSRHGMHTGRWKFGQEGKHGGVAQAVCAMRLDDARHQLRLPSPAHIKLDVDGVELRVLRGSPKTLALETLRTILVEIAPELWAEIHSLLTESGFELLTRVPRGNAPTYAVFVRAARAPAVAGGAPGQA